MKFLYVSAMVVIGLCAINTCEAGWFGSDKNLADEYDKINERLVAAVPNDDADANMAEIEKWHLEVSGRKKKLDEALQNLLALQSVAKLENCDGEGFKPIMAAIRGTRGLANKQNPVRRVDKLIFKYILDFNDICYDRYKHILEARDQAVGEEVMDKIRLIVFFYRDQHRRMRTLAGNQWDGNEACDSIDKLSPKWDVRNMLAHFTVGTPDYEKLKEVPNEVTGLREVDFGRIGEVYRKHIYEPCLQYMDKISPEFYDVLQTTIRVRTGDGEIRERCKDIAQDRIASKICHTVINDQKYNQAIIERVVPFSS